MKILKYMFYVIGGLSVLAVIILAIFMWRVDQMGDKQDAKNITTIKLFSAKVTEFEKANGKFPIDIREVYAGESNPMIPNDILLSRLRYIPTVDVPNPFYMVCAPYKSKEIKEDNSVSVKWMLFSGSICMQVNK